MEILSNTSCCQDPGVNGAFSASETRMASVSESQSLDMHLVTDEGDKVTLSYDAYAAAFYAEYGQVEAQGGDLEIQWAELSSSQYEYALSLSVEGDLNAQEQRDIRKAIKTIGKMLKNFVQGKVKPMMAKAGKLSGLETIASLDISMAYERQVVTARQTDMTLAYDRNADELNRTAAPLEIDAVPLQTESDTLAQEMAEVARAVQAPRETVLQVTERMLAHHRRGSLAADLFDRIRDRFKDLMAEDEVSPAA